MSNTHFVYRNDAQFVNALMNGDNNAVKYLFYDHYDWTVKFIAHKYCGNDYLKPSRYDDIVNGLYLHLADNDWARLRKYNPQRPFTPWFCAVVNGFFYDEARKKKREKTDLPGDEHVQYLMKAEEVDDDSSHDEKDFVSKQDYIKTLIEILESLEPPIRRKVLEAVFFENLDTKEIMKRFGINANQVYLVKSRACKDIRKQMQEYLPAVVNTK